jgi:uncharacterized protein YxjI
MSLSFFDSNSYFIDEKVNAFKFENDYKVYNDKGDEIGNVMQRLSFGEKLLRLVVKKSMLPFRLDIMDVDGNLQASVSRGWTFFMSKITITDANGSLIGSIQQKFTIIRPSFKIFNSSDQLVAVISGDWRAWEFSITDSSDNQIGRISKKWAGVMKEFFTSADKYNVTINPGYTNPSNKIAIIASALTLDMVLKEKKNHNF